jgi:hypothetical protein
MALSPCAAGYTQQGGSCVPADLGIIPPTTGRPSNPSSPGAKTDIFTDIVLGLVGGVIGAEIGGAAGAVVGSSATQAITSALTGILTQQQIDIFLQGGGVDPRVASLLGAGPSYFDPGELLPSVQPFDPGGFGGGVLSAGTHLGQSGAFVGDLLKKKKLQVSQLLTGSKGGVKSALASLLERKWAG